MFAPSAYYKHTRSPMDVIGFMFQKKQFDYLADRKASDRHALLYICAAALGDDFCGLRFTASYALNDDLPRNSNVLVHGALPTFDDACTTMPVIVSIPLNMLLFFKLNTIREYVARKILAGGDTETNPTGKFSAPDYGDIYTSSLNLPGVQVVDKEVDE